jgi:hypothetical protein
MEQQEVRGERLLPHTCMGEDQSAPFLQRDGQRQHQNHPYCRHHHQGQGHEDIYEAVVPSEIHQTNDYTPAKTVSIDSSTQRIIIELRKRFCLHQKWHVDN